MNRIPRLFLATTERPEYQAIAALRPGEPVAEVVLGVFLDPPREQPKFGVDWTQRTRAASWDVLTRHNPFPAIAGRICHHPCESACNRAGFDEALAICRLERFIGDEALAQGWSFTPPTVERAERVAVVGGGPFGLSAAYQLRRSGYQVTVLEAQPALGGLMRYGIPSYRLGRPVLDGEIDRIVGLGVDVR